MPIIDNFAAIRDAMPAAEGDNNMSLEELGAVDFEILDGSESLLRDGPLFKNLADGCEFAGIVLALPKDRLVGLVRECLASDREGFKETLAALKETIDFCRSDLPELLMAALSRAAIAWSAIATEEAVQS